MDCPICMDELSTCKHTLDSGHSFHTHCLIAWYQSGKKSCPLCRRSEQYISKNDMKYVLRLATMESCPNFLRSIVNDYLSTKDKKNKNFLRRQISNSFKILIPIML